MNNNNIVMFIKPNSLVYKEEILSILDNISSCYKVYDMICTKKFLESLYSEHRNKRFFDKLITYYIDKKICVILFYDRNKIFGKIKNIVWHKDPAHAHPNTIRSMFSNDSLTVANKENRIINNVVHFQENKNKMVYEIDLFESYLFKYDNAFA